jgi:membrane fusion protein (multidrug efflux system)
VVTGVYVEQDQIVKQGDLLAKLDPRDYEVKVVQSQAQVKVAQRQVEQFEAALKQTYTAAEAQHTQAAGEVGSSNARLRATKVSISQDEVSVEQTRMQVASMQARQQLAALDWERCQKLDKNGAVSRRELEQSKAALDDATAQLAAAKHALTWAEIKVAHSRLQLSQAHSDLTRSYGQAKAADAAYEQRNVVDKQRLSALASLEQAQAKLNQDLLQLSYCEIRAPISGKIGKKNLEIGQHLDEGQSLLAIFDDHPWITANFKETQVGKMTPGQEVEVKVDSFPGVVFHGHITSIAPASGARYALLPPENATGNFTKIVQRVPVRIMLDANKESKYVSRLVPGMSTETTVLIK